MVDMGPIPIQRWQPILQLIKNMIEATYEQYNRAICSGLGQADKRIYESPRTQEVEWTILGRVIARKVTVFKRRKPVESFYYVSN